MQEDPLTPVELPGQYDHGIPTRVGMQNIVLRQVLVAYVKETYCDSIVQYSVIQRVEGTYGWPWFQAGISRVRRSYRKRYITCDMGIAKSDYRSVPNIEFAKKLGDYTEEAFEAFCERLKKDGEDVDSEALLKDVRTATDDLLSLVRLFDERHGVRRYTAARRMWELLEQERPHFFPKKGKNPPDTSALPESRE